MKRNRLRDEEGREWDDIEGAGEIWALMISGLAMLAFVGWAMWRQLA